MPGGFFAGRTSDRALGPPLVRARLLELLVRPASPSIALGIAVGASFIAVETLAVCLLNHVTGTTGRFGTLYLLGVLMVSTVWGFGLSATMSIASAVAFAYFRNWPATHFAPFEPQNGLVIVVFLVVALLANTLAGLARVGERFFNLSSDLLCITGPEYMIRVNPAFERTFGYPSKELQSRPYLDLVVAEDRDRVRSVLQQRADDDETVRFEDRIVCSDGSQRWIDWSVVPRRGLFYAVGRDVTERRREQDELKQAQRNVEASRDELRVLAEQQAALRRVATLVARAVSPSEVFAAVALELARFQGVYHHSVLFRYEHTDAGVLLAVGLGDPRDAAADEVLPPDVVERLKAKYLGARFTLEGDSVAAKVLRTGHAARMDSYENAPGSIAATFGRLGIRTTVGAPIIVDGRVWGAAIVGSTAPQPFPSETEARISDFADLVATSIANATTRADLQASRDALHVLAEQQAALRRVATLVARGVSPSEVFFAVADEMAACLHAGNASVNHFEDDEVVVLALSHLDPEMKNEPVVGERHTLEGDNIATRVSHTRRPARLDDSELQTAPGSIAARLREMGFRCTVAVPIIVDARVWGMAAVGSLQPEPLPPDTEARMSDFADLVATAVANAATRAELIASRARIVAAADDGRRRLERDLHDGAQQRLVALGLQARMVEAAMPPELDGLKSQLSDVVSGLTGVSTELQEISRGIHPAILSKGGLGPALKTLARRSTVPVALDLALDRRLPDPVEVGAYYFVSEALTNTAKHARASQVTVYAESKDDNLYLSIHDDGIGGATFGKGSGLIGLKDRAEALRGHLTIVSPPGRGTSLDVTIPLDSE
jgi:PAS domain S-box-containing protein